MYVILWQSGTRYAVALGDGLARRKTVNPSVKKYRELNDKELVRCSRAGDPIAESVLISRYQYLAHVKARSYFLTGADH